MKKEKKMDSNFIPFDRFPDLFKDQKTKKDTHQMQEDAKKWWIDNYGAKFAPENKTINKWHFSGGLLIFIIPKYGDYYYKHAIKMIHFHQWKVKEFFEGFRYYMRYEKQRDINEADNPYPECNFYARSAWAYGFWYGHHKFYSKFNLPLKPNQ